MHTYIHIYDVKLLSGPSLALLEVIIWSKFVFSKTPIATKHYKNRGFSPFFWKIARKHFGSYYLVQVGVFLRRSQLGPDNNFQLGPDNNFQKMPFFFNFLLRKNVLKCLFFIVFFEKTTKKIAKKKSPKKR